MMLIGYLYGIRSERQLEIEITYNGAYRWFLGLGLTDRVPDQSTISYNRTVRFEASNIFQEIFDEVVQLAIQHHLVGIVSYSPIPHIFKRMLVKTATPCRSLPKPQTLTRHIWKDYEEKVIQNKESDRNKC